MQASGINKAIEQKDITIRQLQKQLVRTHSMHKINASAEREKERERERERELRFNLVGSD